MSVVLDTIRINTINDEIVRANTHVDDMEKALDKAVEKENKGFAMSAMWALEDAIWEEECALYHLGTAEWYLSIM